MCVVCEGEWRCVWCVKVSGDVCAWCVKVSGDVCGV